MNKLKIIVLAAVMLGAGAAGGYFYAAHTERPGRPDNMAADTPGKILYWYDPMKPEVHFDKPGKSPFMDMQLVAKHAEQPSSGEKKALYWYDPMKPEVHFDKPGKSPFMDMQLVAKMPDDAAADRKTVRVDSAMVQNLGIRTAKVMRAVVSSRLRTVGMVVADERHLYTVVSRASGYVERLYVRAVGDPVKRGQALAGIYSPEILSSQQELLIAARSTDHSLLPAARQRLSLLGLTEPQIDAVLKGGKASRQVTVFAPSDGIVTELAVREGAHAEQGMALFRIADLSQVWITVEVPEAQAQAARTGDAATAEFTALPGRRLTGRVDYVYPELNAPTRTLRVRLVFDNPQGVLKPGMYADVTLNGAGAGGDARHQSLTVPTEALIRTGTRTVLIVQDDAAHFRPVSVSLGASADGRTAILSGVTEGETVVTSGQFLIDSEASLSGAFERMDDADAPQDAPSSVPQGTEHRP